MKLAYANEDELEEEGDNIAFQNDNEAEERLDLNGDESDSSADNDNAQRDSYN